VGGTSRDFIVEKGHDYQGKGLSPTEKDRLKGGMQLGEEERHL